MAPIIITVSQQNDELRPLGDELCLFRYQIVYFWPPPLNEINTGNVLQYKLQLPVSGAVDKKYFRNRFRGTRSP